MESKSLENRRAGFQRLCLSGGSAPSGQPDFCGGDGLLPLSGAERDTPSVRDNLCGQSGFCTERCKKGMDGRQWERLRHRYFFRMQPAAGAGAGGGSLPYGG